MPKGRYRCQIGHRAAQPKATAGPWLKTSGLGTDADGTLFLGSPFLPAGLGERCRGGLFSRTRPHRLGSLLRVLESEFGSFVAGRVYGPSVRVCDMQLSPNTSQEKGAVRQRAENQTVAANRSAMQFVHETQNQLDAWHLRTAHLRAVIDRGGDVERAKDEAADLAAIVLAGRIEFEKKLDETEEVIRRHSLIRDITRSLKVLRGELESLARRETERPFRPQQVAVRPGG
jgi:hypothetical protein